jgi:hypothetical protein
MEKAAVPHAQIQYVAYDKKTGQMLSTHSQLDAETGKYVEIQIEELKKELAKIASLVSRLTDKSADNLDVIRLENPAQVNMYGPMMVDVKTKRLVSKPILRLKADKTELLGDGADMATIEIHAVDAHGKPVRDLDDEVRVTTERGKLSTRGGLVKLIKGRGKITLTSVNETVHKVRVRAESVGGHAGKSDIVLEFV